jgi:tetratricopeptide (TPR) repeat protein
VIKELNDKAFRQTVLLGGLLAVVCIIAAIAHWPALSAQASSLDDQEYLHDNYLVRNPSWASARRFLTEVLEPSTVEGYYQPLTMISLMLDCAMGGGPDNLKPIHITSLFLHIANTALVIVLLYTLFGEVWPAVMAGLLFGVHPLTVDSIVWVVERKTVLASFFALCCMIFYIHYTKKSNWKFYIGCVLMYVLALMAKPITTPVPILLLLFDFWPLRRLSKRSLVEKVPLFVIGFVFGVITVISQSRTAAIIAPAKQGFIQILLIICHNIIFYLYKVIWPVNLTVFYPFPEPMSLSNPMVLAGVVGSCVLICVLFLSLRWTRAPVTGWLIFFVAIFPTLGIIRFTDVIAANRFLYFPSIGYLLIVLKAFSWLWHNAQRHFRLYLRRIITIAVVVILALLEIISTRSYLVHWRDSESHFRHVSKFAPDSAKIHDYVGLALAKKGKSDEAIFHFTKALQLDPNFYRAHINLGIMLAKREDLDKAIEHFFRVIQLKPKLAKVHHNLALALFSKGDIEGTIKHYRESLRLEPYSPETLHGLSWILATSSEPTYRDGAEALVLAKRACELTKYRNPEPLITLAAAYAEVGHFSEAVRTIQKAVDLCISRGNIKRANDIAKLQELYKTGKPYRTNQ